jgi:hypothetical protein
MPDTARISDLHRSAFWIWGVTAMIMREPFAVSVRALSVEGFASPSAQMVCLRTALTLMLLSRQFLNAGIFFDRVYMRPDSAGRFPVRSYPLDFLYRMMELLVAVAASTTIALEPHELPSLSPFAILTGVMLMLDALWLAVARAAKFSTASEIAPAARNNSFALLLCAAVYSGFRAAGADPPSAEAPALLAALMFTCWQLGRQIRTYGQP